MKIKTSEMEGAALDWAVAGLVHAEKWRHEKYEGGPLATIHGYRPSADWSQGGPLIEKHVFRMEQVGTHDWIACLPQSKNGQWLHEKGSTPLIAAMRAIVASELGDTVDIPEELS